MPREHREHPLDEELESLLRLLDRDLGHRRLHADQQLELRHEQRDQLAVAADGLLQRRAPAADLRFALAQDLAGQALAAPRRASRTGCRACTDRTCRARAARARWRAIVQQLIDQRRLADAGIPRHQHQLGRAGRDAIECRAQRSTRLVAAVQALRR